MSPNTHTSNSPADNSAQAWSRGHWSQTYSGRQFYPMDPQPEDIDIVDIAQALSMQCRFNGHVSQFYSVAEHCVLLSHQVPAENALWALLHDATEAYVGDMIRPLKKHMPEYQAAEHRVMVAIAERFGIEPVMPSSVRDADNRILLDERLALLGPIPADWGIAGEPLGVEIRAWTPQQARAAYEARFAELSGERS